MSVVGESASLASVATFRRGLTYAKSDEVAKSETVVLRATNIDVVTNKLDLSELRYISDAVLVPEHKRVQRDSILVCTASGSKGHLGKTALIDDDYGFAFGGFMGLLIPGPKVLPKFLHYALSSAEYRDFINALTDGANINNLKFDDLGRYKIYIPPLKEQRRIVTTLDNAIDGIGRATANVERNIKNARAVFESAREEALAPRDGWQTGPLGDIYSIKHGFAFKGEFFRDAGHFVLLTPGSFFEHGGYRERGSKTKYYVGEVPPEFILKKGDLLTAMTEQAAGLLGSPLMVPASGRFLHNQRLGLFVPKPGRPWAAKFFFHVLNLARVRKELHASGTGAKVRHTSPGRIQAVRVSYPESEKSQQEVADRLDRIAAESEQLERIYAQKLAVLNDLKTSLLHHAFAGVL